MQPEMEVRRFDPQAASDAEFQQLNAFERRLTRELRPECPPSTLEESIADRRHPPDAPASTLLLEWHARRTGDSEIVASAGLYLRQADDNRHAAWFWISVLPEMRRQGIASRLLRVVADACKADSRRLLMGWTSSTSPAGDAFMRRLGAEVGQQMSQNQLLLAEVDRGLLRHWIDRADNLNEDFELVWYTGPYPEEELPAIARAQNLMNYAPRDNLDWEDTPTTVEDVRHWEASILAAGEERWMLYARHRASNELVGFTFVHYRLTHPEVVSQGDTAVAPAFRNRGIGRLLKATMMEKVIAERPLATRVRTGNATSNAAMLKINQEMGFRLFRMSYNWQVPLDQVTAYLDSVPQEAR